MSWIILLFQVCNIVPVGKNFPRQPYNSFFFATKVENFYFIFYFIWKGWGGGHSFHVEILGNIVAAGENFPIQHLYM